VRHKYLYDKKNRIFLLLVRTIGLIFFIDDRGVLKVFIHHKIINGYDFKLLSQHFKDLIRIFAREFTSQCMKDSNHRWNRSGFLTTGAGTGSIYDSNAVSMLMDISLSI
jgi:hypothetical protein